MISFNKVFITGKEMEYIGDCIQRQRMSGDGYYTQKVNAFIESHFGSRRALMTTSCSAALEMAAMLLDLKEGDEVILPSFTFVSTANAIVQRGATPVFVDICEETLNMNPNDVVKRITSRTKAVMPVHYAGVACEMDPIMDLARSHGIKVIEDAAQGVNAKYKDSYLGTIGDIGCYSFHETKNYSCGEGGAILLNTEDRTLIQRAEIIREKGTNRSQFFRGEVDKYTWVDLGSSYLPSDLLAAFLYAQFEKLEFILEQRKEAFFYYYQNLRPLEKLGLIRLPFIPSDCTSNYHIFYIIFQTKIKRDEALKYLQENGVSVVFHYVPLHTSPMGSKLGYQKNDLPITERVSERLLRLPLYPGLTTRELEYIVNQVYQYFKVNYQGYGMEDMVI